MYLIEIRLYSTVHCTLYSTLSTVYIEGVTLILLSKRAMYCTVYSTVIVILKIHFVL